MSVERKSWKPTIKQRLARSIMRIFGWKIAGEKPSLPKYVIVAASHTSNWDFILGLFLVAALDIQWNYVGKDSLFRGPLGIFMRRTGGIPVNRSSNNNFVQQMVEAFNRREEMVLAIAPEGTRTRTGYWRSGFYYIATGAGVPMVLAYLDYQNKTIGIGPTFEPSGDIHADLQVLRAFYENYSPKYPQDKGEIMLRPKQA